MSTICFYAQFTASRAGLDGLTVTWDVERVTRSDGTRSALVTGGANSITVGRRGLYGYLLTSADLHTYDYIATAITTSTTADVKEVPAVWTLFSLNDNIDAAITSRLASAGYTAPDNASVTAIKAKTDNLPLDPADQSAVEAAITAATSPLATAVNLATVDTVVDAIKAKTDNLPLDPADQSAIEAAITAATSPLATAVNLSNLDTYVSVFVAKSSEVAATEAAIRGADSDTLKTLSDQLDGVALEGAGSVATVITVNDGANPLDGVNVWVATSSNGSNIVAQGFTSALGTVTLYLDPGTYYVWKTLAGYSFTNPSTLVVT